MLVIEVTGLEIVTAIIITTEGANVALWMPQTFLEQGAKGGHGVQRPSSGPLGILLGEERPLLGLIPNLPASGCGPKAKYTVRPLKVPRIIRSSATRIDWTQASKS